MRQNMRKGFGIRGDEFISLNRYYRGADIAKHQPPRADTVETRLKTYAKK